jgi:peptidoglycan/xylan/chitin deacetylase (PgdA/CDA1 family)
MSIKVFLFHRINPIIDPIWQPISPVHFEQIITHLKRNFEVVPLEETILGNYKPTTSKKLCAITFDDGYKDFAVYAMPIIRKHKVPASVYIITDCVDGLPPWSYLFNHLLLNTSISSIEIDSVEIPHSLKKKSWKSTAEKVACIKQFSPVLKRISDEAKDSIMNQVMQQTKDVELPKDLMLNWDDIRLLKDEGIEIGSHSGNHPALSDTLHLDSVKHELARSGEEIKAAIGKFPLAISYPFGIYHNEVKNIAKEVGYKMGLTVLPKPHSLNDDQFEIPRIELYSEPFYKSHLRINGQLQALKNIFSLEKPIHPNR